MYEILFGALLGTIFSIIVTAYIEKQRNPSLKLEICEANITNYSQRQYVKRAKFLSLKLINTPQKKCLKWFNRNPAFRCRGSITFYHLSDGQNVFGRSMVLRWTNLPDPDASYDPNKYNHYATEDIYPGDQEGEELKVAARFDDDEDCYGWTHENFYSKPLWRHPEWRLPKSRYLVRVEINTSGEKCSGLYRLINDVDMKGFRLEKPLPEDKDKISKNISA